MAIEAVRPAISNVYARPFNAPRVVCSNDKHGGDSFCVGKHSRFSRTPMGLQKCDTAAIADDAGTCPGTCLLGKNRGRPLLLRLEPGTVVPRHRHLGEVHGFNLQGERELIESGEIGGPGGYVYEPPGNVDSWRARTGDCLYHSRSARWSNLDESGNVLRQDDPQSLRQRYVEFCQANGVVPIQLGEP